jgi:uncharacterized membrane protein YfcA
MSQHEIRAVALACGPSGYVPIMTMLANLIRAVAGIIVAILIAGILLVVLGADQSNRVVKAVLDAGHFFQDPFGRMFKLKHGKEHLQIVINWGLTAVIYGAVGALLAGLLSRTGSRRRI